jgi:hypothetical protein
MRLDALAIAELLRKFREAQRTLRQSYRAKPIYPPQDPERATAPVDLEQMRAVFRYPDSEDRPHGEATCTALRDSQPG